MTDVVATVVVVAVAVVSAASWWRARRQQAELFRMARGRSCPQCARPTRVSQMVAVELGAETWDPSRVINDCPCGERTMFDARGAAHHVDPPGTAASGGSPAAAPAIGAGTRWFCGVVGAGFVVFSFVMAAGSKGIAAIALLVPAFLCLSIALFATGPPAGAPMGWGRASYRRVRRFRFIAMAIGVLGIGVSYLLVRWARQPSTPHSSSRSRGSSLRSGWPWSTSRFTTVATPATDSRGGARAVEKLCDCRSFCVPR